MDMKFGDRPEEQEGSARDRLQLHRKLEYMLLDWSQLSQS
jgi:hypothetical protein